MNMFHHQHGRVATTDILLALAAIIMALAAPVVVLLSIVVPG